MLTQGDKTKDTPLNDLAKEYLVEKYQKSGEAYLGVPHRIDRPTSGLVLLSKTSKALVRLNKMFQDKEIQKTYWAVVKNKPAKSEDTLIHFLVRNPQKNKSTAHKNEVPNSKRAELSYRVLLSLDNYHLLVVYPKTGRHHQIRSQLSAIGCSIKGDVKYGFDRTNSDASIHLHARSIQFIHPVSKEEQKISAPAPVDDPVWKACMKKLKGA
ncbi:MAG: RNA pseudouridine synthase [Flavobacteriales bacterium]|nr:RNA pseudouridine synthase [Flavobacteriales bacterium]